MPAFLQYAIPLRVTFGILALMLAVQGAALWFMGQPAICECGHIDLWEATVLGPENSQHVTDWYTFSHIIHGVLFYLGLSLVFPRMPRTWRILLAAGIEISWELFENTDFIINRYRETALAQGYVGDSILNSLSDTTMAISGFVLAARAPVWLTIAAVIVLELIALFIIRDNLTLNIIALIHPLEFIQQWQAGI